MLKRGASLREAHTKELGKRGMQRGAHKGRAHEVHARSLEGAREEPKMSTDRVCENIKKHKP